MSQGLGGNCISRADPSDGDSVILGPRPVTSAGTGNNSGSRGGGNSSTGGSVPVPGGKTGNTGSKSSGGTRTR
ncbi:hypothetical protein O1611_g6013 [Lasiodiplodia mahajangana]|uniref:Uncharacterized protein n=1 Tax=Lasiodiplodia mahajangana TaxID=1108764 RepID=A0ACC2JJI3_9PEZI|nr:hypothetical protein O1611_g6013 [Lasiodiplodia mahajangana]